MKEYNERYFRPVAMNMAEEDGKIWMALLNRNGICEVDMATWKARILKIFEGEPLSKEFLYCYAEKVGKYLVFSPGVAEKIAVYDLECDSLLYLPLKTLERKYKESQKEAKFWNIISHKFDVYLLGYSYPAIVKIDMNSMELTYITDWVEEVEESIEVDDNCGYFSDGHVLNKDKALIPVGCMKAVLELDLRTDQTKLRKLDVSMKGIGGLASVDGENIWLIGRKSATNHIVHWNQKNNTIKEILLTEIDGELFEPFHTPICTDSKVLLLPCSASCIYEIEVRTEKIVKCSTLEKELKISLWRGQKIIAPKLWKNCVLFLTYDSAGWHEYNLATGKYKNYSVCLEESAQIEEAYVNAIYKEWRDRKQVIPEAKVPLEYFVNRVLNINYKDSERWNKEVLVGNKIYSQVGLDENG